MLGTWNSPLAHSVAYGAMRQGRAGIKAKFVQVEPRMSQTGASADEWVAARSGTEGALALGLAHVMLRDGFRPTSGAGRAGALIDGWPAGLPAFTPAEVEKLTGVAAARVERLAREMAAHGPTVAAIGGAPLAHSNGLAQALAVNALNALLGSVGVEGGVSFMPQAVTPAAPARTLPALLAAATPQVLLLDEANPVFGAPAAWKVEEWLRAVPFIASFGSFVDDTSVFADLILPDHSFLESWVDSAPESGATQFVATVAGPVSRPLYDTRSMPDVLLDASRRLKQPLSAPMPWQTFEAMLQTPAEAVVAQAASAAPPAGTTPAVWRAPELAGDATEFPFQFLPFASQAFADGSVAHLPWLQELPDPLTTAMWSSVGRAERRHRAAPRRRRRRHRGGALGARVAAGPGGHLSRHRPRHGGDAGGPGPRALHPLRQRPRRQPAAAAGPGHRADHRATGVGGDPRRRPQSRRCRRAPDSVCRRHSRAARTREGERVVSTPRSLVAFGRRCIPPRSVARRSNTLRILPPRALRAGRLAALDANETSGRRH